jgi:hypothetical protein
MEEEEEEEDGMTAEQKGQSAQTTIRLRLS